ncbi:MAG: DUF3817 domain-containing protein [Bacteroidota bacterium]
MSDTFTNFLKVGKIEGYSYLVLLFVAMPLKYIFEQPVWVRVIGSLHGILFVAFMYLILKLLLDKKFTFKQSVQAFLLSIIPFGTFYLKRIL